MKLKLDADGHAVLQDGKPVYISDDGKETAIDVAGTIGTIARLNAEARGHREGKEAAETALKSFAGITDPAAAIKAMQLTANLDAKKLIDAGEVETVKAEITKGFTEKLTTLQAERDADRAALYAEKIGGAFARSKFVADKVAIPADMLQTYFGKQYKIEDGKVAAYDTNGNKIYSRAKPGEIADFEESLEILVDGYAHKDHILKGNSNGGSGARQSDGGGASRRMTTAAFGALDAKAKAAAMASGTVLSD